MKCIDTSIFLHNSNAVITLIADCDSQDILESEHDNLGSIAQGDSQEFLPETAPENAKEYQGRLPSGQQTVFKSPDGQDQTKKTKRISKTWSNPEKKNLASAEKKIDDKIFN